MDIGETEKVHEVQPSEVDVAPAEAPSEPVPGLEPTPEKPAVPEREKVPA